MNTHNDDKQFEDVISTLKQLKKVEAPPYFESDLKRKINQLKHPVTVPLWKRFLIPSRLIPSAAMVISAVLVIFVVTTSSEEPVDPFSIEPRLREDLFTLEGASVIDEEIQPEEKEVPDVVEKRKEQLKQRETEQPEMKSNVEMNNGRSQIETDELKRVDQNEMLTDEKSDQFESTLPESLVTNDKDVLAVTEPAMEENSEGGGITKQSLNFRQVNLSTEEQTKVMELKNRLKTVNSGKTE